MRAAVLSAPGGALQIDEVESPAPRSGEVLVDVTACGICGTDLHIARNIGATGTILGHEIAGRVSAAADDVTGWPPGTPVAVRPFDGCDRCSWCWRGRADHCTEFRLLGLHRAGGFAEQVTVGAGHLFRLPAAMPAADQALVEPCAVALHALRRVDLRPGEDVVVLGAGPVGLAVTAWARGMGAGRITVCEPVEVRRDLALHLGADVGVDPTSPEAEGLIREAAGAPVVLECTGAPGLLADGLAHAGPNGRVGVVGICLAPDVVHPLVGLHKELDVRFAMYYDAGDFVDTIDALEAGSLDVDGLVTESVPLAALPRRFDELTRASNVGKVIVTPR